MNKLQHLLNKVNKVTSCYRHGREISNCAMDALCNAQIEFEQGDETIRLLEKELDDVNDVVAHYGSDVEYKAFLILREENKQMKSDLKELIHDNSRYIKTNSELATESERRAEVINKRDGTIKQLQKRIRTLEKPDDIKVVEHPNDCGCYYCTPII